MLTAIQKHSLKLFFLLTARPTHVKGRRNSLSPMSNLSAGICTLETFITDADSARGAVSVPTAELGARFSDVHVVDCPALLLSLFPLLDPAELCGTEASQKESKGH